MVKVQDTAIEIIKNKTEWKGEILKYEQSIGSCGTNFEQPIYMGSSKTGGRDGLEKRYMYIYTYIFEETVVRKLSALMETIHSKWKKFNNPSTKETRTTSNHIIIRLFKIKDKKKILKEARKRERERDVT